MEVRNLKTWSLLAVLTVCMAVSTGSCTSKGDNTASRPTIDKIEQRGELLIGTTGDYRPLSFREPDGTYWGFGIDVAQEIASRMGVDIEFVQSSWPTLTADVLAEPQLFDFAIGGITITDARRETMLMSDGYLANGKTILCRAADAARFQSLADIDRPEVRVMVNPGGLNENPCRHLRSSSQRRDTLAHSSGRCRRDDNRDNRSTILCPGRFTPCSTAARPSLQPCRDRHPHA